VGRFRFIQNNFLQGEVSPKFFARTDLAEYRQSCETLENMICLSAGGVTSRKGSEFITDQFVDGTTESLTPGSRAFPFVFSKEEAYVIIFKPNTDIILIRNIRSGQETIIDASSAMSSVDPNLEETFATGLRPNTSQLAQIQYAQTGDFIYFVHPAIRPFFIVRTGTDTFSIDNSALEPGESPTTYPVENFAYEDLNTTAITITATSTTGNVTLTASSALFTKDHVGSVIAFTDSGVTGVGVLVTFTTSTSAVLTVTADLPAAVTGGITGWTFEAWSIENGFPRSITFHEQRLIFGGNEKFPDTVWASRIANIFKFTDAEGELEGTSPVVNDDPFRFTIASTEVNQIQWLESAANLEANTSTNVAV